MIESLRTVPIRRHGETILPLALAVAIALLGAIVYLELVAVLLEYTG